MEQPRRSPRSRAGRSSADRVASIWKRLETVSLPRVLPALVPVVDLLALSAPALASGNRLPGMGFAALAFVALRGSGQQRAIHPRLTADLPFLLGRVGASLLITALITAPLGGPTAVDSLVRVAILCTGSLILGRAAAYKLIVVLRARGLVVERVIIAGAGDGGIRFAQTAQLHHEFGLVPVGFLDSTRNDPLPLPVLGGPADLEVVVRDLAIRRVVVAPGELPDLELVQLLGDLPDIPADVYVIPRTPELLAVAQTPQTEEVWGVLLVRLRSALERSRSGRAKRVFDIAAASLLLVLAAPILGVAALAVRLSSPGPLLIHQKRVGRRGEIFELIKFRTMIVNEDGDTEWSVEHDPRITPIGRILRRFSVDELPQLINVLHGDMSLVGPRPERPHFVDRFRTTIPDYEGRLRVLPGVTGWAQVHGLRGNTSIRDRSTFDNLYVERWSLWQDLVILARTLGPILWPGRYPAPVSEESLDVALEGVLRTEIPPDGKGA